jgi:acetylornithine/N-succinyldiaminopimelate aminotransferase
MKEQKILSPYVLPTYGRFPIQMSHGKGCEIWDTDGKRYLDFCSGIAVSNLGHAHHSIIEAIKTQSHRLLHCSNLYHIPEQAELARFIVEDCVQIPGKVFFSNSGAEANDGLIKSARRFGHAKPKEDGAPRFEILTFKNSFHGRTMGSMFATGQAIVHDRFDPIPHGYRYAPFNDIHALENAVSEDTVAILLEPIQGEGGVNVASKDFLDAVDKLCKKYDLLLFIDEVQSGCGDMMAWRSIAPDLKPDGISWAKGMGGGVPIGAFWLSDRAINKEDVPLSSLMGPKSHGSTYGGNPLVSAVSLACLQTVMREGLNQASLQKEAYFRAKIEALNHPAITEVRGIGLLLGIGLNPERIDIPEGSTAALRLCQTLNDLGLLTVPAGASTLRCLPPLIVTEEQIDEACKFLEQALSLISK